MKTKQRKKPLLMIAAFAFALTACTKDPVSTPSQPIDIGFSSGIYFINEGNFGVGNASIDFFSKDSNKIYRNVFQAINNRPLGDVAQSMCIVGEKGLIVMNGSARVEVIDAKTAVSIGTINGVSSPRYIVARNNSIAYLSDWISNSVKVIDASQNTITNSIAVGKGPEGMTISADKLFVCNSGGYELDSTITVINLNGQTIAGTIVVGDAPVAASTDKNGKVWVLCRGDWGDYNDPNDDTKPKLVRINPNTLSIEFELEIGAIGDHPDKMKINKTGDVLYYLGSYNFNSGLFKFNITDLSASTSAFISGYYYGFGYDKILDQLYLANPKDFSQTGVMYKYASSGNLLDSLNVGIIPNGTND